MVLYGIKPIGEGPGRVNEMVAAVDDWEMVDVI
jgi:hypothetical protein